MTPEKEAKLYAELLAWYHRPDLSAERLTTILTAAGHAAMADIPKPQRLYLPTVRKALGGDSPPTLAMHATSAILINIYEAKAIEHLLKSVIGGVSSLANTVAAVYPNAAFSPPTPVVKVSGPIVLFWYYSMRRQPETAKPAAAPAEQAKPAGGELDVLRELKQRLIDQQDFEGAAKVRDIIDRMKREREAA